MWFRLTAAVLVSLCIIVPAASAGNPHGEVRL